MTQATCQLCQAAFEISDAELQFLERVSPAIGGEVLTIAPPTHCADCRHQRRLAHRNERNLYHRTCALTGEKIISVYSSDKPFTVYSQKAWWSDEWDALAYGQEFDFGRSFFEQFAELRAKVPRMALLQSQNENSLYTNCVSHLKDCYLLFSSDFNRDCAYGTWVQNSQDCFDSLFLDYSELAYGCVFSDHIFRGIWNVLASQCNDCVFVFDCRGCSDCFMCVGLRNKQYCIENQQLSREEYFEKRAAIDTGSFEKLEKCKLQFAEMVLRYPRLFLWRKGRIQDSSGDFLTNVENCRNCFELTGGKDCANVQSAIQLKDTRDGSYVMAELGYENCECVPQPFHSAFNLNSYSGNDLYYTDMCMNSCSNLFGCIALKHQQYCILNRQYSREAYEQLLPRIVAHMRETGEWGEFLPMSLSAFAYNETNAQDEFRLSESVVSQLGLSWKARDQKEYQPQTANPPDSIAELDDDFTKTVLACTECGKNYRIIQQELTFYRKEAIALPRRCPECRHLKRMTFRNPRHLYARRCQNCNAGFQSSFPPENPAQLLCEQCYHQQVY